MFTGIVAELGSIAGIERLDDAARLTLRGELLRELTAGDSVAVDGVCLTATGLAGDRVTVDVMRESLDRSTLGSRRPGDAVNLELAVTPTTRLGGHLVQGHVDAVAAVVAREPAEHWELVTIELPDELTAYVVEKGSVTLDGVSLTVAGIEGRRLTVSLIPETLRRTTLGNRAVGDHVNVEVDILGKYVHRMLAVQAERMQAERGAP